MVVGTHSFKPPKNSGIIISIEKLYCTCIQVVFLCLQWKLLIEKTPALTETFFCPHPKHGPFTLFLFHFLCKFLCSNPAIFSLSNPA